MLHIIQCTLPYLMYAVNYIYGHDSPPSAQAFQRIKHFILYLDDCQHRSIMYDAILDGTTTHEIRQEVSPCDFHSKKISNGLVSFADGGGGLSPNDKRYIACAILCIFGFSIHW